MLPNEMGRRPRLARRYRFAALLQVLQQPGHVPTQRTHNLQPLYILSRFARQPSVHAVPVLRRHHRHVVDSEILVQAVERRTGSPAAAYGYRSRRLVGKQTAGRIEQTVEQGAERAVGTGIIYRRPYHDTICRLQLFPDLSIQFIIEHTPPQLRTTAAGNAPLHRFGTDGHNLGLYPICLQRFGHFRQSDECISLLVRTSVNQQNFHLFLVLLLQCKDNENGKT